MLYLPSIQQRLLPTEAARFLEVEILRMVVEWEEYLEQGSQRAAYLPQAHWVAPRYLRFRAGCPQSPAQHCPLVWREL